MSTRPPQPPNLDSIRFFSAVIYFFLLLGAFVFYALSLREPQRYIIDPFVLNLGQICMASLSLPILFAALYRWLKKRAIGLAGGVLFLLSALPIVGAIHLNYVFSNYQSNCVERMTAGGILSGCELSQLDLTGQNLPQVKMDFATLDHLNLSQADLTGATFRESTLTHVQFNEAQMENSIFLQAHLTEVVLANALLDQANFTEARLTDVDLSGASLDQANFTEAVLENANLTGASFTTLTLDHTGLLNVQGVSDEQWAGAMGVPLANLSATLNQLGIYFETFGTIGAPLAAACQGQPVSGAGLYGSESHFHAAVLIDPTGQPANFRREWSPAALRFADLVVCLQAEPKLVEYETCEYQGGPPITRYNYQSLVRLHDAKTGELLLEETLIGQPADPCPEVADVNVVRIEGEKITTVEIENWLAPYVNPAQ